MTTFTQGIESLEFLLSEAAGKRSRDQATVTISASTALPSGTVLGRITATGKLIKYLNAAVDGSQTGMGAATGAVVGGVAGSQVGGNKTGAVVGVLSAVAGAVAGNAIERMSTKEDAVEILIQLRNGERRAIVQAKGSEVLQAGDAVILVTNDGKTRVMKAPAVVPVAQPN